MPDSQPNYLTTDADGRIGAEFSGHISAAGIDLDAASDTSPEDDNKVRWIRQADGSVVAEMTGYHDETLGDNSRSFYTNVIGYPAKRANNSMLVQNDDGSRSMSFNVGVSDSGFESAGGFIGSLGQSFTILNADQKSSFVQTVNGVQRLEIMWDAGAGLLRFYNNGVQVKTL